MNRRQFLTRVAQLAAATSLGVGLKPGVANDDSLIVDDLDEDGVYTYTWRFESTFPQNMTFTAPILDIDNIQLPKTYAIGLMGGFELTADNIPEFEKGDLVEVFRGGCHLSVGTVAVSNGRYLKLDPLYHLNTNDYRTSIDNGGGITTYIFADHLT